MRVFALQEFIEALDQSFSMLQFFLHGVQVALSAYALLHSSISIPNLQKYEETSKKAARISSTAENELNMTRKTQAAGAVGVCENPKFKSYTSEANQDSKRASFPSCQPWCWVSTSLLPILSRACSSMSFAPLLLWRRRCTLAIIGITRAKCLL